MINNRKTGDKIRFNWIDQTKGLAILAILIFHFFQIYPERIELVSILDKNTAKLGYAAVDIFFVMAGFNTSYSLVSKLNKIHWKSWLIKRLTRIYPAYLIAVILSCLFYYLFSHFTIKNPENFILSVLGFAGIKFQAINPGFWFFTVILEAYLVTPLMFYFCKNNPKKILSLGLVLAISTKIISFYYLNVHDVMSHLFFLQNNFLGSYLFQFNMGLYWGFVYTENQGFRKTDFIVSASVFAIGLFIYTFLALTKIKIIYMLGFDMLFTPFFFLVIQSLLYHVDKIAKLRCFLSLISLLGIYSYQIYLIHQPLYSIILPKLTHLLLINSYFKIIACLAIVSIILTVYSFLFTKLDNVLTKKLLIVVNN